MFAEVVTVVLEGSPPFGGLVLVALGAFVTFGGLVAVALEGLVTPDGLVAVPLEGLVLVDGLFAVPLEGFFVGSAAGGALGTVGAFTGSEEGFPALEGPPPGPGGGCPGLCSRRRAAARTFLRSIRVAGPVFKEEPCPLNFSGLEAGLDPRLHLFPQVFLALLRGLVPSGCFDSGP